MIRCSLFSYNISRVLEYGLHRANVATRELACAVDWEASQGRCSKLQHYSELNNFFQKKIKTTPSQDEKKSLPPTPALKGGDKVSFALLS